MSTVAANPTMMTVISALALITNIIAIIYIISVSKKRHINPYKEDVFVNQKYYKDAMARADLSLLDSASQQHRRKGICCLCGGVAFFSVIFFLVGGSSGLSTVFFQVGKPITKLFVSQNIHQLT